MPKKNKRVHRVYVGFQSKIRRRSKKTFIGKSKALYQPEHINQVCQLIYE